MSVAAGVIIALGLIAVAFLGLAIGIYNNLVGLRQQVDRAWANIDVILKQRFDEIPQLIELTEQFVKYEKSVLKQLIEARQNYGAAKSINDKIAAAKSAAGPINAVLALGEAYPELKSNNQFTQIQTRVSSLENQLSDRRETYNETVTNLNTRIQQVPDLLFAGILGYRAMNLYTVDKSETVRPSLKINTDA